MEVGKNVKWHYTREESGATVEDMYYFGTIIGKNNLTGKWLVSITAICAVIEDDGANLTVLS